jgi:excisionase family DNA binding protein
MPNKAVPRGAGPRAALDRLEAAEYTGLALSALKDLTRKGEIPYVQSTPQTRVYLIKDLDAWLEARRVVGQKADPALRVSQKAGA